MRMLLLLGFASSAHALAIGSTPRMSAVTIEPKQQRAQLQASKPVRMTRALRHKLTSQTMADDRSELLLVGSSSRFDSWEELLEADTVRLWRDYELQDVESIDELSHYSAEESSPIGAPPLR
mmetsp:Transcript_21377/g.45917  ORF Transcript_21377/g.45917 Transcript_21377/m.45917 type:complete len:122 (-) Transcript_21377:561-926(-)